MEFVEVQARTVDEAIAHALTELGIENREFAEIEVLQEPDRGFLGIGRTDAIVRVRAKPKPKRRRRRRRGKGGGEDGQPTEAGAEQAARQGSGQAARESGQRDQRPPRKQQTKRQQSSRAADRGGQGRSRGRSEGGADKVETQRAPREEKAPVDETPEVDINEQADVVRGFLEGLLGAFGLEGTIDVSVDGNYILADISGEQTEALIGPKAAILQAIHELTKTVVQRRTQSGARIRLDIGGYAERRREALTIYAGRLAEQVLEEGEEIMLEPMTPPDRKVVHDAIGEIEGVRSFSEGEEPRRSVVIAPE